jgi:septal ring factor EnvC (AmiA/AmiB activator)
LELKKSLKDKPNSLAIKKNLYKKNQKKIADLGILHMPNKNREELEKDIQELEKDIQKLPEDIKELWQDSEKLKNDIQELEKKNKTLNEEIQNLQKNKHFEYSI